MDDPAAPLAPEPEFDESADAQAEGVIQRLFVAKQTPGGLTDPQVAPLFPGYPFDIRLVAGITPIEKHGILDFCIDRPKGMRGWIINLTVKGRGIVFEGGDSFDVGPGDLLLFPPGTVHCYGRHPADDCWWHRWVYFQPRAFWLSWLSWKDHRQGVHILRRQDDALFHEQDRLFAGIMESAASPDRLATELSMNLLERLVLLCAKQNQTPELDEPIDERLAAACKFMTDNLHQSFTVEQVARHACLSPSRLTHLFTKHLGRGVMHWWEEQRVQFAIQILRMTGTPIKQVAAQVGYSDPLYFSRVFRKHTGFSPRAFRERHGG